MAGNGSGGGGGGDVNTITGDTGTTVRGKVLLYGHTGSADAGSTVKFNGVSLTEMDLVVTDINTLNTMIGFQAGRSNPTGLNNTGIGTEAAQSLTTGSNNTCVGVAAGDSFLTGSNNTCIGNHAGSSLQTSAHDNTFVGNEAGGSYSGTESSNIVLGAYGGTASESNSIHIGVQGSGSGQQNTCFIAGIVGNTVSNAQTVTINSSTGQLGVTSGGSSPVQQAVVTLTSSQILNGFTTPVQIIASPGAGKYISIYTINYTLNYGVSNTPFTTGGFPSFNYSWGSTSFITDFTFPNVGLLDTQSNLTFSSFITNGAGDTPLATAYNQPIKFSVGGAAITGNAGGDSTVTLTITYLVTG